MAQKEPVRVWSDYGGQGRYVTIRYPRRTPGSLLWGLGRFAPRSVIEGAVIHKSFVEGRDGGEGPSTPDRCWLAVDDGASDVAWASLVSGSVYAHIRHGDLLRMTVVAHQGRVFDAELLSAPGQNVGPIGSVPDAPDAPIDPRELARVVHRVVRSVEPPAEADANAGVRTWTYHLGGDEAVAQIQVHLGSGPEAVRALIEHANRSSHPAVDVAGVGDWARRFGDLLIARKGDQVVGVQQEPGMVGLTPRMDEELARIALRSGDS